jgi:type I restriction enzyme S subunit
VVGPHWNIRSLCVGEREAARQAEHLFQTLPHRAFRGELTADEGEMRALEGEIARQEADGAGVVEPIGEGALQLALPLE